MSELVLRPRQLHGRDLVHAQWRSGKQRVLYVMPTGAGKRYCAVWWAKKAQDQGKEVLIVTDRRILVKQMYDELHRFNVDYGVIMNGYERENLPTVQVASIHTLRSRHFDDPTGLPPADLIIVDEAHKELDAYRQLFTFYQNAKICGLTATPAGPQGRTLVPDLYEVMVEGCRNTELIGDGLLLPTRVIAPSEPSIEGVQINGGKEFNQTRLSKRVSSVTAFGDVFKEWEPFSDRQTIVFAPGVAYCRGLAGGFGEGSDSFWSRGVEAAVIHAGTKQKQRDEILDRFCSGSLKVLLSVDVLREGFDAPIASCAIDLQPNSQLRTYWQKVGRIKRAYEGQTEAVYIDMAGNIWRHIHPDDDPDWDALTGDQTTQDLVKQRKEKKKEPGEIRCPACGEVRRGGMKCPSCGHECEPHESVRRVRMGKGKLKEIPLVEKKKAELTDRQRVAKQWKSELFIGLKTNRTLLQCKTQFKQRHGDWPPDGLPGMPSRNSVDWKTKVGDKYTTRDLMTMFVNLGV